MSVQQLANLPHWDLNSVYPGLESEELANDRQELEERLVELESYLAENSISRTGRVPGDPAMVAQRIAGCLERMNAAGDLYETLESYLYSFTATDSYNKPAARLMSLLDQQKVRLEQLATRFQGWLGALVEQGALLEEVISLDETVAAHAFYLRQAAAQSRYLMSEAEEALAAELSLSGAVAWTKLQEIITSQITAPIKLDSGVEELPLALLITYLSEPDGQLRERAYKAIMQGLAGAREPLAACLNGVKGAANTINIHRGREDALHDSLVQSRIDREVLNTLLAAMTSSFPLLRRYLMAKARLLGKERLDNWDQRAPVGNADHRYEWDEARSFILTNFATFSPKLEALARRAFDEDWIDAEPRDGKGGGGFCMRLPAVEESRISINYDGRMGQLSTLAHELGHAYHNECLRGRTNLLAQLPMTLAETASIFCETIVTDAILDRAADINEELAVLDSFLQAASGLTLEIQARYRFELEVFDRRAEAELSADEICQLADRIYRESYGTALADGEIWPYAWSFLPHYYLADLPFYNYPYTFGFLFGLGIYRLYKQGEANFHESYDRLLADAGTATAADLGERFGIDLSQPDFWAGSYDIVRQRVERFEELVRQVRLGDSD
jgi:pepF/M3 family oligoendopeptidase